MTSALYFLLIFFPPQHILTGLPEGVSIRGFNLLPYLLPSILQNLSLTGEEAQMC